MWGPVYIHSYAKRQDPTPTFNKYVVYSKMVDNQLLKIISSFFGLRDERKLDWLMHISMKLCWHFPELSTGLEVSFSCRVRAKLMS